MHIIRCRSFSAKKRRERANEPAMRRARRGNGTGEPAVGVCRSVGRSGLFANAGVNLYVF